MKQRRIEEEDLGPMKLIFNYENVFYSFFYDDISGCIHRSREYAMNYVYSGEMILDNGKQQIHVGKGECVYIPRDHHITMYKRTFNGERYCGIFLNFTRNFLREMYAKFGQCKIPADTSKLKPEVIKLPKTAEITSLFASLTPFFDPEVKPRDDFMHLKLQEGLLALLHIDGRFASTLFDFNEPWKIDILDYLNENYMCDLSMKEIASYTGRSLATFKRDFAKVSDLTPQKWIIRRRLEAAHDLIRSGKKKVTEACFDVGFKNLSHFSKVYKETYGVAPSWQGELYGK